MRVKTIEEARQLINRCFKDRKGLVRIVTRITELQIASDGSTVIGNVYWRRPGGDERPQSQWLPYFCSWLTGTEEVEVSSNMTRNEEDAKLIVDALLTDLCGRSGLENEWDAIDEDIRKEIRVEWEAITDSVLRRPRVR